MYTFHNKTPTKKMYKFLGILVNFSDLNHSVTQGQQLRQTIASE